MWCRLRMRLTLIVTVGIYTHTHPRQVGPARPQDQRAPLGRDLLVYRPARFFPWPRLFRSYQVVRALPVGRRRPCRESLLFQLGRVCPVGPGLRQGLWHQLAPSCQLGRVGR